MKLTAKDIALDFSEKFQNDYPGKKHIVELMLELEKNIEQFVQQQINNQSLADLKGEMIISKNDGKFTKETALNMVGYKLEKIENGICIYTPNDR